MDNATLSKIATCLMWMAFGFALERAWAYRRELKSLRFKDIHSAIQYVWMRKK